MCAVLSHAEEEYESEESIIINENVLFPDHIPSKIIGREKQLKELFFWYETILRSQRPVNVLIKGMPGTGKTLVAQYFAELLQEAAEKRNRNFVTIYIDCNKCRGEIDILINIIIKLKKKLNLTSNVAGLGFTQLVNELEETMARTDAPRVLLILDETNLIIQRKETGILHLFTRSPSLGLGSISLILIALSADVFHRLEEINPSTLSSLGHGPVIKMEKYTKKELVEIIGERAKLALAPDGLLKNELELIADIASYEGNARLGIEILWAAAKIADKEQRSRIEPDDIRAAKNYIYPEVSDTLFLDMNEQELLVYYAVVWYFDEDRYAIYAETTKIWPYYTKACKDNKIESVSERQYRNILERLGKKGLVSYVAEGKGKTTTVSLEEVPSYVLKERIEEHMKKLQIHEKMVEIDSRYNTD